jgi:hypothetical protein
VYSVFKTLRPLIALFAALFTAATFVHAQSVRWEPGSGTLALNQISELSLVFDQCEPSGTVAPPSVTGLSFIGSPNRSESTSFNVVNFKATSVRTVTLTYRVRPTERTTLILPAFNVETDKGRQRVASATFEVGDATIGQSGLSAEDVARSAFTLPSASVWAGEVFPLTYTLNASKRYLYNLNKDFEWNSAPLSIEPWPNPEQIDAVLNNDPRVSIVYKTRALVKTPGDYALHPATQLVNISTGSTPFGMFARTNLTQLAVTSPRVDLTVKPLPAPAPAGFNGAVGKFTLDSKVVPATAAVGEPITWTLTLDGHGNWPDVPGLPSRSVSKDFRIVQPQAKRTNKDNALFDASITEDIVLIPTKPGSYTLGPVTFAVFNPATGAYETLTTKPVTIQVAPAVTSASDHGGAHPRPASETSAPSDPMGHSSPDTRHSDSSTVGAIPRDPLPTSGTVVAPLSRPLLVTGLLSSVLCPLFLWLALALRRARVTDPSLPQREAHIRLSNTLRQLASTTRPEAGNLKTENESSAVPSGGLHPQVSSFSSQASDSKPPVSSLLQSWQRDTAILWNLPQAVPTPASFLPLPHRSGEGERPDSAIGHSSGSAAWSTLWAEADRTLYGAAPLPADWTARATQALAARRAPAFNAFQLFLPRNLLPLVILFSSLVISHSSLAATDGANSYAQGNFPAAETAWTNALKTAPTDWSAHHNLALALIQQNRPGEAAGHALAAFVQQPQNPSVRWHLDYAFKSAGVTPAELRPFLTATPVASLARLASPTRWQTFLIASAWLAALALSLGIWAAHRKSTTTSAVSRWSRVIAHGSFRCALGAAALLLAAASGASLHTYGPLSDARAVVVVTPTTLRSIPTELETQKSTPLSTGVVAATDKAFLGWRRLVFPDGQTGWVRVETLVPLWK